MQYRIQHIFAFFILAALPLATASAESTFRSTIDAAEESSLFQPWSEDLRVSFEQVLADPDNVELNFRYAQTLLHDGRPKDAVPTLQRILAKQPELVQVRLLYTTVLLRLDNLAEADRELAIVQKAQTSEQGKKQLNRLAKKIAHQRQTTRWDISLSTGLQYDQNRNAAPASGEAEFSLSSTPVDVGGAYGKENDLAFVTALDVRVQHDLQRPGQPKLIGGLRIQNSEQVELGYLDLWAFELSGGAQFNVGGGVLTSELLLDQVIFANETYLKSIGGRFEYQRALSDRIQLTGRFQTEYQDYDRIKLNPRADSRDGWRYEYAVRGDYIWNAQNFTGLELSLVDYNAGRDRYAYEAPGITLSHLWIPAKDHFLLAKFGYEHQRYDGANPAISNDRRKDHRYRTRFTYGTTLQNILPFVMLPEGIDDIVASVSTDFFIANSNIRNYEYSNNTYSLMFTKRWKL